MPSQRQLFTLSAAILFLELFFIRWVSTEVRLFAYLQNIILIVCFLGLGLGCFGSKDIFRAKDCLIPLFCIICLLSFPLTLNCYRAISESLSSFVPDLNIWHTQTADFLSNIGPFFISLFLSGLLLFFIWDVFLPLGRALGQSFDNAPSLIRAYSANLLGSLAGTILFAGLGYISAPPAIWALCSSILLYSSFDHETRSSALARCLLLLTPIVVYLGVKSENHLFEVWSPYQKLQLDTYADSPGAKILKVNNVGYQLLLDLSDKNIDQHPDKFSSLLRGKSQYDLPFLFQPKLDKVLIVGSGTGTDVAAALRHGAKEIVAVDIDPVIIQIGKAQHPEQPYSSSRVRIVNDDARAFFSNSKEKFDLIVFGLLDAHTANSLTNVRLDHYVYTVESLASARRLLKDKGVLVLSFGMSLKFLLGRIYSGLTSVFGQKPTAFINNSSGAFGWGGMNFIAGDTETIRKQLQLHSHISDSVASTEKEIVEMGEFVTDDWPYLYLEKAAIPKLYYIFTAVILCIFFIQLRRHDLHAELKLNSGFWHFFFMGAAFLLLETLQISRAALLLGNTWIVNAVVISAILLVSYLANIITERFGSRKLHFPYIGVIAACLTLYLFDISSLEHFPYPVRCLWIALIAGLPALFSSLAFVNSFNFTKNKHNALGANLFGAMVGGLLQCLSFVTGISFLVVIAGVFYALSWHFRLRLA